MSKEFKQDFKSIFYYSILIDFTESKQIRIFLYAMSMSCLVRASNLSYNILSVLNTRQCS